MWCKNYNITIITTKNSWYENYARILQEDLSKLKFSCNTIFNHEEIKDNSIVFYLSYQKIVPPIFLKKAYISFVVHASDLPKGKGFSPWVWQILEGKNKIALSLFEAVPELDAGPIFCKDELILDGYELLDEIRKSLATSINNMIVRFLCMEKIPNSYNQKGMSTFYRKRTALDSELDITKNILDQFNLLRIVDNENYPAFFIHNGNRYTLKIEKSNK